MTQIADKMPKTDWGVARGVELHSGESTLCQVYNHRLFYIYHTPLALKIMAQSIPFEELSRSSVTWWAALLFYACYGSSSVGSWLREIT